MKQTITKKIIQLGFDLIVISLVILELDIAECDSQNFINPLPSFIHSV